MTFLVIAVLIPATLAAGYYFAFTILGMWKPRTIRGPERTFAVLIPAHDEEPSIAATVASVLLSDYPKEKIHVLVVADNCTDRTADVAWAAGAVCFERDNLEERGKGFALAFGIPLALRTGAAAVVILDADAVLDSQALRTFDTALQTSPAVQAAVVSRNPTAGPTTLVTAVGTAIDNAVDAGRTRLGRPVTLRGNGMGFARELLERHPWTEFGLTEDAEYTVRLHAVGIRVAFRPDAIVRSEAPASVDALTTQRRRWRAALRVPGQNWVLRFLSSKPLVLGQLIGTILIVLALAAWLPIEVAVGVLSWCGLLIAMTGLVYLRAILETGVAFRSVCGASSIRTVSRLGWLTLGAAFDHGRTWQRTPRVTELVR